MQEEVKHSCGANRGNAFAVIRAFEYTAGNNLSDNRDALNCPARLQKHNHHTRSCSSCRRSASVQVAEKLLSVEKVADDAGESKDQVRRYIRLTYLIPELLSMVDENKIAFNPAVEISYLEQTEQRVLLDAIEQNDCTPSHAQAIRLKKLSQDGVLDQMIYEVMAEQKPNQQEQIKFRRDEFQKYFPPQYSNEQMRKDILKGLELLKRQRERNRDAR